eukprot:4654180-Ditylum_brightwellii.AAC.1
MPVCCCTLEKGWITVVVEVQVESLPPWKAVCKVVPSFPASYDSPLVMSVAAVDFNGTDFDYTTWDGTSMASLHIAGVTALIWSHHPSKSAAK